MNLSRLKELEQGYLFATWERPDHTPVERMTPTETATLFHYAGNWLLLALGVGDTFVKTLEKK